MNVNTILVESKIIFWDFDGVIKDSVDVKTRAFMQLFESYGDNIVQKVKKHHEANGGMSRFKKIPLYMEWAGEDCNQQVLDKLFDKFSRIVLNNVIKSSWVPGVEKYIRNNQFQQEFILVSATPDNELDIILNELKLIKCFSDVFGSSTSKKEAIKTVLSNKNIASNECVMIGDAIADQQAAELNNINFILRRHNSNQEVFKDFQGMNIKDFTSL